MTQPPTHPRIITGKTYHRSPDEMGRVNLPHVFRKALGIIPGTELAVTRRGQVIEVRVAGSTDCPTCRGTGHASEVATS